MKVEKCYKAFGECYNSGDFTPIARSIRQDVLYESFDFLYKIKGKDKVLDTLNTRAKDNQERAYPLEAYRGFFFRQILSFKRLLPCVILYSSKEKTTSRIVYLKLRRGKIISITGLDPKEYHHTRGDKLTR